MNDRNKNIKNLVNQIQDTVNKGDFNTSETMRNSIQNANSSLLMNADKLGGTMRINIPEPGLPPSLPQAGDFDFNALSSARNNLSSTKQRIIDITGDIGDEATIRQNLLEKNKIPGAERDFADIQGQLGILSAQRDQLDLQKQRVPIELEREFAGRGVTKGGVQPHERAKLQDIFLEESVIAAKQLGQQAIGNALLGNINTSIELVDRAVEAELAPKRAELQQLELQYGFALDEYSDLFSEAERRQLEKLRKANSREIEGLDGTAQDKKDIGKLALAVAQSGASQYEVQQIQRAGSLEEAMALATPFINTGNVLGTGVQAPQAPQRITPQSVMGRPDLAPEFEEEAGGFFSNLFGFFSGGEEESGQNLDSELKALGL